MFSAAHGFEHLEFEHWIFVVVFYWQAQWKKSKRTFNIRHAQIDELPRTFIQTIKDTVIFHFLLIYYFLHSRTPIECLRCLETFCRCQHSCRRHPFRNWCWNGNLRHQKNTGNSLFENHFFIKFNTYTTFDLPYARHHKPLLITRCSWI